MHKRLIEEGFNRRYVLLPVLASLALVVLGFSVTEMRRAETKDLAVSLRERQDLMRLMAETIYVALESESAQRGFLLTGEEKYSVPLRTGYEQTTSRLDELVERFSKLQPEEARVLESLRPQVNAMFAEINRSVALLREGQPVEALRLVKTDVGLDRMQKIRETLEGLRQRERDRILDGISRWTEAMRLNTLISLAGAIFTCGVLVLTGLLASRDIRRRNEFATQLAQQVDARTAELQDLSEHMSTVSEAEKHALARELHDELGGLLVAIRMDLSQIRRRLGSGNDADLQPRWARVDEALAAGVALKQRVIEELRPTLLDNMGLFSALRWQATQHAEQSGIQLQLEGLDEDVELEPQVAIAVFRTAQEAMANVVRHARASRLTVRASAGPALVVSIEDDGIGVPAGAAERTGSHGLKQMRFRMRAVGGTLSITPGNPGTLVRLSVPMQAAA
jgi:signal transduction histidine kinase